MRCPSKKRLVESFKCTANEAAIIRDAAHLVNNCEEFTDFVYERFPDIASFVGAERFDKRSDRISIAMEVMSKLLNKHGVETVVKNNTTVGHYVNAGDAYTTTICHHALTDSFFISCWATAFAE